MRFVAGRGAAAKSHREAAAGRGDVVAKLLLAGAPWWLSCCWPGDATEQDAAGRGRRDRAAAGRGVAAELHREATSRAASAEDQATQRGSTEQQPTQKGSKEQRATQGSRRRIK